jgi:hypothetical protein
MTDEEFLARDYAEKKGQYALQIYFGEAFDDQERSLEIQQEVRENIDLTNSKIQRVEYAKQASERKEKLLGIDKYPTFILYGHKKTLLKTTDLEDISIFLSGENATLEEPFNLISEDFGFRPFDIPDGWEVVIITEYYARSNPLTYLIQNMRMSPNTYGSFLVSQLRKMSMMWRNTIKIEMIDK